MKETDLEAVKKVARSFLYIEVIKTQFYPIVVQHPVFETGVQLHVKSGRLLDISNDKSLELIRKEYEERIKECKNVMGVYLIIRSSYHLTFLKFIRPYLSKKDFSELFSNAWVMSENPNQDTNVPITMAVKWFRQSDKDVLMNDNELKIYKELPDVLEIYRGVSVGREPKGLSWTRNLDTARWFAHRFDRDDISGYIQAASVHKSDVLAYFEREDEIVAYYKNMNNIHIIED